MTPAALRWLLVAWLAVGACPAPDVVIVDDAAVPLQPYADGGGL